MSGTHGVIEIIGFDGPPLVRLGARTAELLSLAALPKPLLLNNVEARVGFEPTYRGFADHETSTFNFFTLSISSQIVHPFVRFWSASVGWR